jgi:hypothetical protein
MAGNNTMDPERQPLGSGYGSASDESPIDYAYLSDSDATDDPVEDAKMVEKLYQEQFYYKYYLEREWYINYAFFHGKHWIAWNRVTNRVEELPKFRKGEVRSTTNFIWTAVTSLQAQLTGNKLIPNVLPKTNKEEDRDAARKAQQILNWMLEDLKYNKKRRDLVFNLIITGTCFLKLFLDIDPGESDYVPVMDEQGNMVFDQNGEPKVEERAKVKVGLDVVTPFDVLVDPTGTDMSTIRWMMHVKTRSLDYIKNRYPKAEGFVKSDTDVRLAKDFEQRIMALSDTEGIYNTTRVDMYAGRPTTTIKEYWEAPSEKYPTGRVLTVASGVLLKAIKNPFGQMPFFPFYMIKNPMRFWGSTPITHIIPIQKNYNERRSTVQETIKKMSFLKWLLPKNSGVADYAMTTEVGEVVEYNPVAGVEPHQARMEPIPAYVLQDQNTLLTEMDMVVGQQILTKPQGMPKNVRTAGAAAMMREMESMKLSPTIDQHTEEHENVMSMLLWFEENFRPDALQTIQVYDHDRTDEVEELCYTGSEIKGNNNVVIQGGTEVPQSKSLKKAEILQYYQMGLLGTPSEDKTRKRVLRMLEFGDTAQIFADNAEEESLIVAENNMMKNEQEMPEVEEFHDHYLHLELHDKILKSEGLTMDKAVKKIFLQHRQAHGQRLEKLMAAMQQGQMAAQPQGKGKGKPGGQGPRGQAAPQPKGIPGGFGAGIYGGAQ